MNVVIPSVIETTGRGERAYDMARAFNAREGFGPEDDMLPRRFTQPLPEGAVAGKTFSIKSIGSPPPTFTT